MPASTQHLIAVEEIYLSSAIPTVSTCDNDPALHLVPSTTIAKLKNLGQARSRDMHAAKISMQILSHVPIEASLKVCQSANDKLHAAIFTNPDRFRALALLPCWDAKEAASELQRCVTKYQFVGGFLGFRRGIWEEGAYDGGAFDELWKVAERYKLSGYRGQEPGHLPPSIVDYLVVNFHALHTVTPLLVLRIYFSGVFDRFPNLHIIISENWHSLTTLIRRIESVFASMPSDQKPKRKFLDVWQNNIYVTTADVNDQASMRAMLETIPVDRVLFGSNYPWQEQGRDVIDELMTSGVLGQEEWEKIAWKNAENLFRLHGGGLKVIRPGTKKSISYG